MRFDVAEHFHWALFIFIFHSVQEHSSLKFILVIVCQIILDFVLVVLQ